MAKKDVLPSGDGDFDTLQNIIVNKVTTNAVTWNIPTGEITKLTTAQAVWIATWLIAKDKMNCTAAQRKAKDVARKAYEKVLRRFIQKWIYRNDDMNDGDVELCGLPPRDVIVSEGVAPEMPEVITLERGSTGEFTGKCNRVDNAVFYGAIVLADDPLPDGVTINPLGQFVVPSDHLPQANPQPGPFPQPAFVKLIFDLRKSRKKRFTGLKAGTTYFVYFYAGNASGISALSEVRTIMCA
jgi:hypothetical protein